MDFMSAREGRIKEMEQPKPLHRGRPPHRNSKGTAFRLFLYIRVFSCVMNTRHGASGDIGFTPKASHINGLRATKQQYLPILTQTS